MHGHSGGRRVLCWRRTFGGSTGWITGRRKALTACHKLDREDMLVYSKLGILYEEATYRAV
jgi:hypothetical protein